MADADPSEQRQALLGGASEAGWAAVPAGPPRQGPSVAEVIKSSPDTVLATLQRSGVQLVAEFSLPDQLVLGRLGDDKIATMGSDRPDLDFEEAWRRELGPCCRAKQRFASGAGSGGAGGNHAGNHVSNHASSDGLEEGATPETADAAAGCASPSPRGGGASEAESWCSEIPVQAYVVSVRDAAAPGRHGLLRPLIRRWQAGGCGTAAFRLPVVQAVVDWKWHFCRRFLVSELGLFLAWLASFFAFALAHRVEDDTLSLPALLATPRGRLAVGAVLTGAAAMLPFVYAEVCTALAYGWGYVDVWRALDLATYALQVLIVALHLGRMPAASRVLPVAAAAQCVLLLFRLQFYSRVFPATRFAFVDDLKEVILDMRWFLAFLVLIMAGFAAAFLVLFSPDAAAGRQRKEFAGLGRSFVTMVSWVAGDPNLTLLYDDVAHPLAACALGLSYVFCFTLVLTTLLISLMTNTLQKVTRDAEARQLLSKALVIDELESTIPSLLGALWPQMHARFIHVLRIDATRLDAVKLDRLWKSLSDEDADALQGGAPAAPAAPAAASQPPEPAGPEHGQPSQHLAVPPPPRPVPHTWQHSKELPPPSGPSYPGSAPGDAPPSMHWHGSLLDAYLGALELGQGSPPEGDALAYQRLLLGDEHSEAAGPAGEASHQGDAGVSSRSSELAALRHEVRELRQLLLAAMAVLPAASARQQSSA